MKKLALYIDVENQGSGVSQYVKSLILALDNLSAGNYELTIVYTVNCWTEYLDRFSESKKVFVKRSNLINRFYQILFSVGLVYFAKLFARLFDTRVRYLDNQHFDYIVFPASDTIACLVKSKVIGTIHDLMHRYERKFKESGGLLIYNYRENYYRTLLKSASIVFVDSNLGKKQALESYRKVSASVNPLPYIAPDYIYNEKSTPSESIKEYLNQKYIFYPAVFWSHKNHLNLLKAMNLLKNRGYDLKLLLGGKKRLEYNKLKNFVDYNNLESNVVFLGYISDNDMICLYKNALAMVMPTYFGPTNIPPIEAILLNCPPIVSNNYAMPEQYGNAALYFNPNEPEQIANAVELLLNDENLRMEIINNGSKIKDKFSQERFYDNLKSIFKNEKILN